jgi:hypothetical protein
MMKHISLIAIALAISLAGPLRAGDFPADSSEARAFIKVDGQVTGMAGPDSAITGQALSAATIGPEATSDTTPPLVVSVEPADGATNVPVNLDRITVFFNEDMDRQTLLRCIFFTDSAGVQQGVNFKLWFSNGLQLQFATLLRPLETYFVHATTECADIAGNRLAEEFISSFTTADTSGQPPDVTPPVVTVSATPETLWPPNGRLVLITISGTITDPDSDVNASTATYAVTDEYRLVQPSGHITLGSNGSYAFTIQLQASRNGNDTDGRQYIITVSAQDNEGNTGSAATGVVVPHDQGQ